MSGCPISPVIRLEDERAMIPPTTSASPATAPPIASGSVRICSDSTQAPMITLVTGLAAVNAGSDHRIGPDWNALWTSSVADSRVMANA